MRIRTLATAIAVVALILGGIRALVRWPVNDRVEVAQMLLGIATFGLPLLVVATLLGRPRRDRGARR